LLSDEKRVTVYLQYAKLDKDSYPDLHIVADAVNGDAYNTLCEMLKNGYRLELVGTPRTKEAISDEYPAPVRRDNNGDEV
jgi:hypothetical protein